MPTDPDLAALAALIGDASRARMLDALLGGTPLSAGVLARCAGVSPATASWHLAKLVHGRLLRVAASGRRRLFELNGPEVAELLETMARLARRALPRTTSQNDRARALRFARTCYDHLAGKLGVSLTEALVGRDLLHWRDGQFTLTPAGRQWCTALEVPLEALERAGRPLLRACMDWSEHRHHLAGALGAALTRRYFALGFLRAVRESRAVRLSSRGVAGFSQLLGIGVAE